jgi:hypothetical protein
MVQTTANAYDYLLNEAQSLLARLNQVKPFTMTMPMVKGASVSNRALTTIIEMLEKGKHQLRHAVSGFIRKIAKAEMRDADPKPQQAHFTLLKLRFNSILDQLDIFADVLTQRAEHEVGVWLCGLDILAEDGLIVGKELYEAPSLMVYVDRGHGAAIRRARTRLPGGDENPVAIIQIPRERMVGSGIASSLIHEVGHQAAALLDLVSSLKAELKAKELQGKNSDAWAHFERWISEIISDVWAMGHLGVGATMGLMSVVTLPKYFQFRLDLEDPHPAPYVRVWVSCAFGEKMFPNPQWRKLWDLWQTFYPIHDLKEDKRVLLQEIEEEMDDFVSLVLRHTNKQLKGRTICDLFPVKERQPAQLQQMYQQWKEYPSLQQKAAPTLVFAVIGQAKSDKQINAEQESQLLAQQLRNWAFLRKN